MPPGAKGSEEEVDEDEEDEYEDEWEEDEWEEAGGYEGLEDFEEDYEAPYAGECLPPCCHPSSVLWYQQQGDRE